MKSYVSVCIIQTINTLCGTYLCKKYFKYILHIFLLVYGHFQIRLFKNEKSERTQLTFFSTPALNIDGKYFREVSTKQNKSIWTRLFAERNHPRKNISFIGIHFLLLSYFCGIVRFCKKLRPNRFILFFTKF